MSIAEFFGEKKLREACSMLWPKNWRALEGTFGSQKPVAFRRKKKRSVVWLPDMYLGKAAAPLF